jgi:hypothetical protein
MARLRTLGFDCVREVERPLPCGRATRFKGFLLLNKLPFDLDGCPPMDFEKAQKKDLKTLGI